MCLWFAKKPEEEAKPQTLEQFLDSKFQTTTLRYSKRWIFAKDQCYTMDVRDFCKSWHSIPNVGSIEQVFKHPVNYVSDNYEDNGILDFWQLPMETLYLGAGDCDDSAVLRYSFAQAIGYDNIAIALGFYGNEGHMFNIIWDGIPWIVENTSNAYKPKALSFNMDGVEPYKICYIFNKNKCWIIDGSINFGKAGFDGIRQLNR